MLAMLTPLLAIIMGVNKTICKISERFMWKGIVNDVKNLVRILAEDGKIYIEK